MNKKLLALAATGLLCATGVSAHDFEVDGIYYNITSEEDKTVEVTFSGDSYDAVENEYSSSVTIPETVNYNDNTYSVTRIGSSAFKDCSSLTSVEIPNSVTTIWDEAFWGCSSLTSVEIPNSVTTIGSSTFKDCYSLTSVEIPNSVTFIGNYAFYDCSSLTSIAVAEDNPRYDSRNNCNAIIETQTNTLIVGCSNTTIPNSVTSIGFSAFSWCSSLTSVVIPNSVTSIGDWAFYNCSSLTSVEIGNSVTSISPYAFSGTAWYNNQPDGVVYLDTYLLGYKGTMPSNTSIKIKEGTLLIADNAFRECSSLTSVEIPNSVTSIGFSAFRECYSLTTITSNIPADKLFSISGTVFDKVDKTNSTLNVPYGAQAAYTSTEGWSYFENIVEMDPPSFDLTVSNAGYATLYLDYAAQIPEGVSVYTANEVEGNLLKMELVEGLLPANTGVVVKAPAGTYTFTYSDAYAPEISDNLFKGSATYEYVDVASTQTAFVLSKVDGEVGMYPAKLTDGRFLNNANKAYLLLTTKLGVSDEELDTSVGGAQLSLRFYFGSTTGVDKVQTELSADTVIYDLYGRKVNKATTPGFYIINNKKVWVK